MTQYNVKFVVINEMPTHTVAANNLSIQMTRDFGRDGWQLIGITAIPSSAGMLLTFQKAITPGN